MTALPSTNPPMTNMSNAGKISVRSIWLKRKK